MIPENSVFTKSYPAPDINIREILRYAGVDVRSLICIPGEESDNADSADNADNEDYTDNADKAIKEFNADNSALIGGCVKSPAAGSAKKSAVRLPEEMQKLMQECIQECTKPGVLSYKVCYKILPVKIAHGGEVYESRKNSENTSDSENRENAPDFENIRQKKPQIDFGVAVAESIDLAKNLEGCTGCVFFATTIGFGIDRLINKYKRTDAAKALFMQAIGAERVEALCDAFCEDMESEFAAKLMQIKTQERMQDQIKTQERVENQIKTQPQIKPGSGAEDKILRPRFSPGYGDLPLDFQKEFLKITDASRKLGISLNDSLLMSPSKSVTAIIGIKN